MEEKELVNKSIFKQKVMRKIYNFKIDLMQSCYERDYNKYSNCIITNYELINEKENEIFVCNLEMPLLEIGEKFYIEELNLLIKIKDRVRTSKENVCYYIEEKIVEDEESLRTKEKAEELEKQFNIFEKENNKLREKIEEIEKSKKEQNYKLTRLAEFKYKVENSFWFKFIKIK